MWDIHKIAYSRTLHMRVLVRKDVTLHGQVALPSSHTFHEMSKMFLFGLLQKVASTSCTS
jgi:hypothetical protein